MSNLEIKLAIRNLPFSRMVVLTGTSQALLQLSAILQTKKYQSVQQFLNKHLPILQFEESKIASISVQYYREKPYTLAIPVDALEIIAAQLEQLVVQEDYSQIALSSIGLLHPDTSKNDLILVKRDQSFNLKKDYEPDADGVLLEALLYHPQASIEQYQQAWSALKTWSKSPKSRATDIVTLWTAEETKDDWDPQQAFQCLLQDPDTFKVSAFFHHPFLMVYGDPKTDIQVWFYQDYVHLMVIDRAVITGDYDADIQNFAMFRSLLKQLAHILNVSSFVWDLDAEHYVECANEDILNAPSQLDVPIFLLELFNGMRNKPLPRRLESEFNKAVSD